MFTNPDPAKRAQYDIVSLDVVWISDAASKGWVIPLDHYWPDYNKTNLYLPIPIQAASYRGELYGAPLHTDVGILYYRTDFSEIKRENIKSWDDLARMAQDAQQQEHVYSGFTWDALPFDLSGNVNEALICNFVEILSGYGGKIFDDPRSPSQVRINSQEAQNALNKMNKWKNTISPGVTDYNAKNPTDEWISGQAAFMRNWPAIVVNSSDHSTSSIADKFNITTLPFAGGCLGGWQLAINSNSAPEKQDKAWNFIWWMLQHDAQHYLAVKENFPVTLAEIYSDPQINKRNIYYSRIQDYINHAQLRPSIPRYQDFTKAVATMINNVFTGVATPDNALPALKTQLQQFIPAKSSR